MKNRHKAINWIKLLSICHLIFCVDFEFLTAQYFITTLLSYMHNNNVYYGKNKLYVQNYVLDSDLISTVRGRWLYMRLRIESELTLRDNVALALLSYWWIDDQCLRI